jgi:hypothetical protein
MIPVYESEIDGVRCFWVDTGRPTLAGQLLFRQGMADEWLVESGWQHLLEHLALHGRGGGALSVNGSVSLLHTSFEAHGPADQVAEHFAALTAWLSAPVFDEFERERGVLRAESALRGTGPARRALSWRYGSLGPGTASFNEPGIARSSSEALTARARRAFGRGNAVLVLDGPPPPSLRLTLPDGVLQRPPVAVPCDATLPAVYCEGDGLILSGVVPRSESAMFVPEILQRALREQLRDKAGAAYAPWGSYEPVDETRAVVMAGSDLLRELLPHVAQTAIDVTRRLAVGGVSAAELQDLKEQRLQEMRDPYAAVGLATQAARAVLNSRTPQHFDDLVRAVESTSTRTVREDLRLFWESMMLGLPSEATWSAQLPSLEFPMVETQRRGTRVRHRDWPAVSTRLARTASSWSTESVRDRSRSRTAPASTPTPTVGGRWCRTTGGPSRWSQASGPTGAAWSP